LGGLSAWRICAWQTAKTVSEKSLRAALLASGGEDNRALRKQSYGISARRLRACA